MIRRRTVCCFGVFGILWIVACVVLVGGSRRNLARPHYDLAEQFMTLEQLVQLFGRPPDTLGPRDDGNGRTKGYYATWSGTDGLAMFMLNAEGKFVPLAFLERPPSRTRILEWLGVESRPPWFNERQVPPCPRSSNNA